MNRLEHMPITTHVQMSVYMYIAYKYSTLQCTQVLNLAVYLYLRMQTSSRLNCSNCLEFLTAWCKLHLSTISLAKYFVNHKTSRVIPLSYQNLKVNKHKVKVMNILNQHNFCVLIFFIKSFSTRPNKLHLIGYFNARSVIYNVHV